MSKMILTIGREYGSGGRYIGEQVAKKLNIPFYDKELINKIYETKYDVNYSNLQDYDEKYHHDTFKSFNYMNGGDTFTSGQYQVMMNDLIKEIAQHESCVILGRNSNNILKGNKNTINIFIYSNDLEFKLNRKMESEHLTREEALNKLKKIDKSRKKYYESNNKGLEWGNKLGYDYLIDSSILGIDDTIDLIVEICKKKMLQK